MSLGDMLKMTEVEIICVGNELLIGKTLNTNENWLAKCATSLGMTVKRITTVDDDVNEIKIAITEALRRKPRFIVMTGGLGPTYDDKTLEGVGKALERRIIVNETALMMVKEKYESYYREGRLDRVELTPSRVKMASIPEGAEPLDNPVGTAPGVLLDANGCFLISLPGVPSEMKAIFQESVVPIMKRYAGETRFFETNLYVDGIVESALAPIIDRVIEENPYIYIKSHPKGEERKPNIEIHLSTISEDSEAKERLEKAKKQIIELISCEKGLRA
jgi:molybdenum cofactor synthesis domain-containing protein